ncbi:MAG: hypothetical protein SP1CHLAM54_13620 [Chlamydiia bacterium]|nr:hypothetical protein [Chlamydiia bacterium]MCH9616255.1 hypothetical protein [Chlamydiia bacterium]MCH9629759.1 hypothetical protein [Chlamydiia bacterium]
MRLSFLYLLLLLFVVLITLPWIEATFHTRLFSLGAISLILLISLYTLSDNKKALTIGICLLIPSFLFDYLSFFYHKFHIISHPWNALFILFIIGHISHYVFNNKKMGWNTIFGALCVYLLIGFTFAQIYDWIDYMVPEAFNVHLGEHTIYFSFVTLTTLGYGDIYPVNKFAQSVSIVEVVLGQLYIATAIARAIGTYIHLGGTHDKNH